MATEVRGQLNDLIECPICIDVYNEPRTLPCQHSFCLVCLERFCLHKHPGVMVECPLCREEFAIPPNGVRGLRKNFVLEKLTQINQTCSKPLADTDMTGIKTMVPSFCDKHATKTIDWYCIGCKEALCANCLTENHYSHDYRNVDSVINELRVTLNTGAVNLQKMHEKCKRSLTEIEKEEEEFMKHIRMIEADIIDEAERLRKTIENCKSELLAEVSAKKHERLKEVDNAKQEARQHLSFVSSLMNYTTELLNNGAVGDVAREAKSLEQRTNKLLESDEHETIVKRLGVFAIAFSTHEAQLPELGNLVGSLTPMKVRAVRSLPEENRVIGFTTLNKQLYVCYDGLGIVVYDTDTYVCLRRRLGVPGLSGVRDLISCQQHQCIYISDSKNRLVHVVRVKTNGSGDEHKNWTVDDEPNRLSISSRYNLIVTCTNVNKIKVFTTDGQLVKVIELQQTDFVFVRHTIELTDDKFVVCHGGKRHGVMDSMHRVCIIDGTGKVQQSFDGRGGSDDKPLRAPCSLAVVNGFIFVSDKDNQRVVMLSPTLRYVRTVVSLLKDRPTDIYFDKRTSRLYVAESRWENGNWTTAHVYVYSVAG